MQQRVRSLGAVLVLSVLLMACASTSGSAPTPAPTILTEASAQPSGLPGEPYKIGAIFGITSPASSIGVPERDTVKMVEEEVNGKGGIVGPDGKLHPINVIVYDNGSQEPQSVTVARKLIDQDRVPVVIGPSQSGPSLAIVDALTAAQVPLISTAASSQIVTPIEQRRWIFKTAPSDELFATELIDYLKAKNLTRIAWLSVNDAFGDSGRTEFEKLLPRYGFTRVADERFNADDKDLTPQLSKIRGTDAQAIIIWANSPGAAIATRNARGLGLTLPILHSGGIAGKVFLDLAGPAANGVLFSVGKLPVRELLPDSDAQKPVLQAYAEAFRAKYNRAPDTVGGHAWDAVQLALLALGKAGPDAATAREQLEQVTQFVGVSGIFNLTAQDHNGLDKRAVTMVEIKDGKYTLAAK